jgi:hypothetical protein
MNLKTRELAKMLNVGQYLESFLIDQNPDGLDITFRDYLIAYMRHLMHQGGLIVVYADELDCRKKLMHLVRSTGPLYDTIAEHGGGPGQLSDEGDKVLNFLNTITLEFAQVIRSVEDKHPHLRAEFDLERAAYQHAREIWAEHEAGQL